MEEQGKLFDTVQEPQQEPQNDARNTAFEQLREVRELRKQLEGTGRYILLPTETLLLRSEAYYYQYVEDVTRLLVASGVTDTETVERVIQDYCYTLMGFYDLVALPLDKQTEVLNAVKPWRLYLTERYGLNLLFGIYFYNVRTTNDYITNFKLATGDVKQTTKHADGTEETELFKTTVEEQKSNYLRRIIYRIASGTAPMLAGAYRWIGRNKIKNDKGEPLDIVEPSDFSGLEPELSNKYLAFIEAGAGIDYYVNYYYIAKYALHATPDELKEIEFPPLYGTFERAQEYAERIGTQRYENLQRKAGDVEKLIDAETAEETERAKQEIKKEPAEPQETIRIPENIALLGSRDVYASVNGTQITEQGVIPISKVISIYGERKKDLPANVTPLTVEKTILGLNMLQRFNHEPPVNGWFTYQTNITEFSRLCGYDIANAEEKAALMHCLLILRDLYVVVWKPKGRVAIQLLVIPEIGVSGELKGQFKLQVNAEALKGHQNYITLTQYDEIRKKTKGQAQHHFNAQLIAKGQKEENALLNEVFGYDTMIFEATGHTGDERTNPEAVRNVKEFIRKNKPAQRKKLQKWFEEYTQNGILETYSRTKNARGEYVYKWKRANIPKEQGLTTEEPDEQ